MESALRLSGCDPHELADLLEGLLLLAEGCEAGGGSSSSSASGSSSTSGSSGEAQWVDSRLVPAFLGCWWAAAEIAMHNDTAVAAAALERRVRQGWLGWA